MGKKIALLDIRPESDIFAKWGGEPYLQAHAKAIDHAKADDTEIMSVICAPAFWKAQHTVVDYFMNGLAVPTICKGALDAEEQGAEAAIIVCTDDPGLQLCRQLVDIPVIGEFESMAHMAAMMGHKFGVIAWPTRPFMARTELKIQNYGLAGKAITNPVEPIVDPGPDAERTLVTEGLQNSKAFVEKYYVPAAQRLIQRGAEVIIIDSTGLSLVAANAGLTEISDLGVSVKPANASVPVLNAVTISLKFAEMMVDLQRLGIAPVSRIGLYQKTQETVAPREFGMIREAFEKDWQPHSFMYDSNQG